MESEWAKKTRIIQFIHSVCAYVCVLCAVCILAKWKILISQAWLKYAPNECTHNNAYICIWIRNVYAKRILMKELHPSGYCMAFIFLVECQISRSQPKWRNEFVHTKHNYFAIILRFAFWTNIYLKQYRIALMKFAKFINEYTYLLLLNAVHAICWWWIFIFDTIKLAISIEAISKWFHSIHGAYCNAIHVIYCTVYRLYSTFDRCILYLFEKHSTDNKFGENLEHTIITSANLDIQKCSTRMRRCLLALYNNTSSGWKSWTPK